jgi:DNA-binding CsgD family transcriptional regulator
MTVRNPFESDPPSIVVVTAPTGARRLVAARLAAARTAGWTVVRGWQAPMTRDRVVCTGTISTADGARRALLAALAGAGLVLTVRLDRVTVDRFLDDLRRLGPVELIAADDVSPTLSLQQRALLARLGEGLTLPEAAAELGLSPRTAGRRVTAARRLLAVSSTAEAIVAAITLDG